MDNSALNGVTFLFVVGSILVFVGVFFYARRDQTETTKYLERLRFMEGQLRTLDREINDLRGELALSKQSMQDHQAIKKEIETVQRKFSDIEYLVTKPRTINLGAIKPIPVRIYPVEMTKTKKPTAQIMEAKEMAKRAKRLEQ